MIDFGVYTNIDTTNAGQWDARMKYLITTTNLHNSSGLLFEWEPMLGLEGFDPSTWSLADSHSLQTKLQAQSYFSSIYLNIQSQPNTKDGM